ncbi:MAG: DegV family protein [Ruminococcaceae bacterium]|nr:DegV family protein [Oscillospiraceae bacterium]
MKIKIIADSSGDIASLNGFNFQSVPLTIFTDERSYADDKDIDLDDMLSYLANYNGRSFTACPNTNDWLEAYEDAEELYVVTITSGLSGTYNSAKAAADIYTEKHPHAKIHVFDSLSTGPEMRLMVDKIAELVRENKPFTEIVDAVTEYQTHTRLFVMLESFNNLANNGRVSKTVAHIAGVLGIRIMATASLEGTIEINAKCHGEKGALKKFLSCMKEAGYQGGKVYISHCRNNDFATKLKTAILTAFPEADVVVYEMGGLCSYYAEKGGIILGCECTKVYGTKQPT